MTTLVASRVQGKRARLTMFLMVSTKPPRSARLLPDNASTLLRVVTCAPPQAAGADACAAATANSDRTKTLIAVCGNEIGRLFHLREIRLYKRWGRGNHGQVGRADNTDGFLALLQPGLPRIHHVIHVEVYA